jgi:serine/threonine protein kinase/WD40 repeat protein
MTEPSLPEESIFGRALEIADASERAAFLDRACGHNPALRAEVEALLRAHEQSGDLLDLPEELAVTADLLACERPGMVIGPYKLLEQIGEGGMGTVWMAEQTEPIQRRVAVKVVKEGMDSRQVLARFEAERQALALMEHPNIAKVLDAGRTPSGRPFFVMELVKGKPITQYCDDKRLGVRERLELFGDVCRAVQHAHQKGIIHRDLKPSNVLVAPYDGKPVVKVIDFGVAKATGQRLTDKTLFTGFGALVGTLEYMSPEQAEVNNQDIDTRSDVYSLGVVLYELLTGSTPLTRKRLKESALLEVLRVIREGEPPRPSTRLSESKESLPSISAQRQTEPARLAKLIRGELDWIVMKALEKDRKRRYETANEFARDIQRYLADEPVLASPPSAVYRLRKFVRRNKAVLATVGLVAVILVVGAGISVWQAVRANVASAGLEKSNQELTEAVNRIDRERRAALDREYEALLAELRSLRHSGRPGQRFDGLRTVRKAMRPELFTGRSPLELRNAAVACLCLPDVEVAQEWDGRVSKHVGAIAFDPTWARYAYADQDGKVTVHAMGDGKVLMSLRSFGAVPGYYRGLQFSSDGRCLGQRTAGTFLYWRLDGAKPVELFREVRPVFDYEISPDSRQVALVMADRSVSLRAAADGREEKVLPANVKPDRLRFHPTRPDCLLVGTGGTFYVLDLNSGRRLVEVKTGGVIFDAQWHPNGERFAVVANREVLIFDAQSGRRLLSFDAGNLPGASPPFRGLSSGGRVRFSHAGDLIAGTDWTGTLSIWDARSGHLLLQSHGNMIQTGLWFSPDDKLLAGEVMGSKIRLLRLDPGLECGRIAVFSWCHSAFAVTGDGCLAALTVPDGAALIDLHYREEVARLPARAGHLQPLRFLPNGTLLTGSIRGVLSWPVKRMENGFRIGQPRDCPGVDGQGPWETVGLVTWWGSSADGKVVASPDYYRGTRILRKEQPPQVIQTGRQRDVRACDVSPDGTLVAAASHRVGSITVWDARRGSPVKKLTAGGSNVRFSPDGRWLAVHHDERCEVWRVGDWRREWSLEGPSLGRAAFTPDGRLMALSKADEPGYVRLLRPETGAEVACLFTGNHARMYPLGFTPDGGRFCAAQGENNLLYVWDLTRIRRQLRDLGLDWDDEPLPPPCPAARQPLAVELDDNIDATEEMLTPKKK